MDFIDSEGFGNCLKRDYRFDNSPFTCFIQEPSECHDKLYVLYPDIGKTVSAVACDNSNFKFPLFILKLSYSTKQIENIK